MNILYISNSSEMYGANNSLLDILTEIQNRKYNVVVVVMKRSKIKKELVARGIKTYEIDYIANCGIKTQLSEKMLKLNKNLSAVWELKKIVNKEKIDIIHTNASNIDIGAMTSLICKIPHIWHIREMLYQDYGFLYDFPILTKFLFKVSKRKIAISNYVKVNRRLSDNTVVIRDGFNLEKYNIERTEYFKGEKLGILYCGILSHQKGVMDIVKAINYLVQNNKKEIELYIAGDITLYGKRMQKYVKRNNLKDYVHFCGYQKDLNDLRRDSDIAIMSSRSEALGRVTIESMLSELLVIGADAGATSEIVEDGVTGILYTPGDIRQLASILSDIKKDSLKNIEIIKKAKKYSLENFGIEKYVDELVSIYKELA